MVRFLLNCRRDMSEWERTHLVMWNCTLPQVVHGEHLEPGSKYMCTGEQVAKRGMAEQNLEIEAPGKASEQVTNVNLHTANLDCAPGCLGSSYHLHAPCCQTMSTRMATAAFIPTGSTYSRLMGCPFSWQR